MNCEHGPYHIHLCNHENDSEFHDEPVLKHCPQCDAVYCTRCGKVWGERQVIYVAATPNYLPPYQPYNPQFPGTAGGIWSTWT